MVKKWSRSPTRNTLRHHCRALTRSTVRSLPGYRRGPDPVSQALTAFARAIRCHRLTTEPKLHQNCTGHYLPGIVTV